MAALTDDYEAERQEGDLIRYKIYADEDIYKGAIVMVGADGYLRAATDAANSVVVGVAAEKSEAPDNDKSGDRSVRVHRRGVFKFATAFRAAQRVVGDQVFVVDDNTVGEVGDVTNDLVVGQVVKFIDSSTVKVDIQGGIGEYAQKSWSSSSSSFSSSSFSSSSESA